MRHSMRTGLRGALLLAAGAATAPWASGAVQDPQRWSVDLSTCLISASSETIARACNAVIEAGTDTPANLARAYLKRAGVRVETGADGRVRFDRDIGRAIADFNEAIRLDPTLADAYAARASAWREQGAFDRAIADYDEAIRLTRSGVGKTPGTPQVFHHYLHRGQVWHDKGEFDRAIADFDAAIATKPGEYNHELAMHNRGLAFRAMRDFERALADFSELIRVDWSAPLAYADRGWLFLMMGELRKASDDFSAALGKMQQRGALTLALYGRGLARQQTGDEAGGHADMAAAARIDQRLAEALAKVGTGLLRGDAAKARIDFDFAFNGLYDSNALALVLYGRGTMGIRGGDRQRGNEDIAAARILDPTITDKVARLRLK